MTDPFTPIDLPDDFGLDDDDRSGRVIAWIAGAILVTTFLAAIIIIGVLS